MDVNFILVLFFIAFGRFHCSPVENHVRIRRETDLSPGNWDSCKSGGSAPDTRVDTVGRVIDLRANFAENGIQAYYIPSEDAHQSEYPSDYDKRRGFITGFQGSAGYAVVTTDKQALWTDGRYFLEAEDTLDCNWILMRIGETGVPSATTWLTTTLTRGSVVGASPFLVGSATWKSMEETLNRAGITLKKIDSELIDQIWTTGRPAQPNTDINALPMQFAGRSWEDKISDMRRAMAGKGVDMLVVTGLDETAWLFNLRAQDITYNPFFISYAILEHDKVRLYILDKNKKLTANASDPMTTVNLATHLNTSDTGACNLNTAGLCVEVHDYDPVIIISHVNLSANSVQGKVWLGYSCNYAIYSVAPKDKIHQDHTPIATTKCRKNPVEVEGMKKSHIRDAVALISFLAKLESEVRAGGYWTEVSAAEDLEKYRRAQEHNRGLSFNSISGVGANGAIIHYGPANITDKQITTTELYLLDSGGQYLDGTTDVTRTFHFGTPTPYEKECYTRVLMGHINLFHAIWPKGLYGREIDALARAPLWNVGLIYRHGTGHGIGMYLSVHEGPAYISKSVRSATPAELDEFQFLSDGPGRVSLSHASFDLDEELDEFQFYSDEPGYYEDGMFGIRLENIVMVKNASTKYSFPGAQFLTFDHVTLVPYEPNLIDYSLLNEAQIQYLNNYYKMVRDIVGPELQRQGQTDGYNWMMEKTKSVSAPTTSGIGQTSAITTVMPTTSGIGQTSAITTVMVLFIFGLHFEL